MSAIRTEGDRESWIGFFLEGVAIAVGDAEKFHTPEYFYFSPETLELAGFKLDSDRYIVLMPNQQGSL